MCLCEGQSAAGVVVVPAGRWGAGLQLEQCASVRACQLLGWWWSLQAGGELAPSWSSAPLQELVSCWGMGGPCRQVGSWLAAGAVCLCES